MSTTMLRAPLVVSLPIADRSTSFKFYRESNQHT